MNIYKTHTTEEGYRKITRNNFEADTLERSPWYQKKEGTKEKSEEATHLAVCPVCDNPIIIIGLIKSTKPYGRHHHESVPNLAMLNIEEREFCPLYNPNLHHNKGDRKKHLSNTGQKIIQSLLNNFDRIIYLLKKETGIHFSENLITKMLGDYKAEQGYLYTGATLLNTPWMLAYMMHSQTLYMQSISNEALLTAIKKHVPEASLIPDGSGKFRVTKKEGKAFFQLYLCFIHHKTQFTDQLIESMKMIVSTHDNKIIYQEIITFNYDFYQRICAMKDFTKNLKLQAIAKEYLFDLLPTV